MTNHTPAERRLNATARRYGVNGTVWLTPTGSGPRYALCDAADTNRVLCLLGRTYADARLTLLAIAADRLAAR